MAARNRIFLLNTNLPDAACGTDFDRYYTSIGTNNGNAYIAYAVAKLFGLDLSADSRLNNIWSDRLSDEQIEHINAECSHVFVILQDHLREDFTNLPFGAAADTIARIDVPIVVWSLGANSFQGYDLTLVDRLGKDQVRFFRTLAERAVSIGVRGAYTAEVLDRLGIRNHEIVGCPSYFESGRGRLLAKQADPPDDFKVVAMGAFANEDANRLEYVYQSERFGMKLLHFPDTPLDAEDYRAFETMPPALSQTLLRAHTSGRAHYFNRIDSWKRFLGDPAFLFAIGSRLHGAIAAMNAGLPALVTSGDARAKETCAHLGIPYDNNLGNPRLAFGADLRRVYEGIDVDSVNTRYGQVYARFVAWIRGMGFTNSFDNATPRSDIAPAELKTAAGGAEGRRCYELIDRAFLTLRARSDAAEAAAAARGSVTTATARRWRRLVARLGITKAA